MEQAAKTRGLKCFKRTWLANVGDAGLQALVQVAIDHAGLAGLIDAKDAANADAWVFARHSRAAAAAAAMASKSLHKSLPVTKCARHQHQIQY